MTSATKTTSLSIEAQAGARTNPHADRFGQMDTSLPSPGGARAC
jgi:hypothetical protein